MDKRGTKEESGVPRLAAILIELSNILYLKLKGFKKKTEQDNLSISSNSGRLGKNYVSIRAHLLTLLHTKYWFTTGHLYKLTISKIYKIKNGSLQLLSVQT